MKVKIIIIVSILIVLNGIFNIKVSNLVVTIPEIIIILYFLTKKQTSKALFWHTIFFVTSYSNIFTEDFLFFNNITSHVSYNYAHWGFHGLRFSLVISFLLIFVQNTYKIISDSVRQTVFYRLFKFLLYCVATGFILGGLGLIFMDYSLSHFLQYGYYSLFCYCFAWSFLYEYETPLKDQFYEIVPSIITIAVVFNLLCSLLGLRENMIIIGSTGIEAYCFVLIPLLLFQKKVIPVLIVLLVIGLQVYLMSVHTSGKQIYSLIILFVATLVLSFSKNIHNNIGGFNISKIRLVIILIMLGYPTLKQTLSSSAEDKEGNLEWKIESVESLTNFFTGKGGMKDVSASPYIRLAEISNIIYEDIRNPIYLLFGRGFGGYYRDELNLFSGLDLANGAFSLEQIRTGKFSYGHDSFVTVPMLNGFVGFFMLLSLIIIMCKKSSQNYLYLSSLMFLLLWFYFDILMGIIGVMLLYAAEHKVAKK